MKATHLRTIRNMISGHIDYIREIQDQYELVSGDKSYCKAARYRASGMYDALNAEDVFLSKVYEYIGDMIDEVELEDAVQDEVSE